MLYIYGPAVLPELGLPGGLNVKFGNIQVSQWLGPLSSKFLRGHIYCMHSYRLVCCYFWLLSVLVRLSLFNFRCDIVEYLRCSVKHGKLIGCYKILCKAMLRFPFPCQHPALSVAPSGNTSSGQTNASNWVFQEREFSGKPNDRGVSGRSKYLSITFHFLKSCSKWNFRDFSHFFWHARNFWVIFWPDCWIWKCAHPNRRWWLTYRKWQIWCVCSQLSIRRVWHSGDENSGF